MGATLDPRDVEPHAAPPTTGQPSRCRATAATPPSQIRGRMPRSAPPPPCPAPLDHARAAGFEEEGAMEGGAVADPHQGRAARRSGAEGELEAVVHLAPPRGIEPGRRAGGGGRRRSSSGRRGESAGGPLEQAELDCGAAPAVPPVVPPPPLAPEPLKDGGGRERPAW